MVDYRSSSYKKLAKRTFSKSPSKDKPIVLDEKRIVKSGGQVAVSGRGDYSNLSKTAEEVTTKPTTSSSTSTSVVNPYTQPSGVQVKVSGGVAQKLAQQSLRGDSKEPYVVSYEPRRRESVDYNVKADNEFVGARKTGRNTKEKIKDAYEASPLKTFAMAGESAFKKPSTVIKGDPFTGEFYSDISGQTEEYTKQREGQKALQETLIFGGTLASSPPSPIGSSKSVVASKSVTKVISGETGGVSQSVVSGEALVKRSILGIKLPELKAFFKGTGYGKVEETGFIGGVSKEPILKTSSESKFDVSYGRKKFVIETSSKGGSVGEVGQRQTGISVTTPKGFKTIGSDGMVETFVTKQTDDIVYGGVVSPRGVNVFSNKKILDVDETILGKPIVKSSVVSERTGLDIADPKGLGSIGDDVFSLKQSVSQKRTLVNTKVFEGGDVGQSAVPFSAGTTQRGVIDLLKRERAGMKRQGATNIFKESGENIAGSLVSKQSKKSLLSSQDLDYSKQIESGINLITTPKSRLQTGIQTTSLISKQDVKQGVVSDRKIIGDVGGVGFQNIVINKQRNIYEPTKSNVGFSSNQFSGISILSGRKSRNKLINIQSNNNLIGQTPAQDIFIKQGVSNELKINQRVGQKQTQKLTTVTIQKLKYTTTTTPFKPNIFTPTTTPPNFKIPSFNIKNNNRFIVQERRFGKFQNIGGAIGLEKARQLGESRVSRTLGASYRVLRGRTEIKVSPGRGFYQKGNVNIQQNKFRLSTGSEISEIQLFKQRTSKKRRVGVGL